MVDLQTFLDSVQISQSEAARQLDMHQPRISEICRGVADPRLSEAMKIQGWANDIAKRKKMRKSQWLSWSFLVKR